VHVSESSPNTNAISGPSRLRKKYFLAGRVTSVAEANVENRLVVAAVNRCATQNQEQRRVFPQPARALEPAEEIEIEEFECPRAASWKMMASAAAGSLLGMPFVASGTFRAA
jgi:hypothetical protein